MFHGVSWLKRGRPLGGDENHFYVLGVGSHVDGVSVFLLFSAEVRSVFVLKSTSISYMREMPGE